MKTINRPYEYMYFTWVPTVRRGGWERVLSFSGNFRFVDGPLTLGAINEGYTVYCEPDWVWGRLKALLYENWYDYDHISAIPPYLWGVDYLEQKAELGVYGTVDGHLPKHIYYQHLKDFMARFPQIIEHLMDEENLELELRAPLPDAPC